MIIPNIADYSFLYIHHDMADCRYERLAQKHKSLSILEKKRNALNYVIYRTRQ